MHDTTYDTIITGSLIIQTQKVKGDHQLARNTPKVFFSGRTSAETVPSPALIG